MAYGVFGWKMPHQKTKIQVTSLWVWYQMDVRGKVHGID